jgi:hypothetical protein
MTVPDPAATSHSLAQVARVALRIAAGLVAVYVFLLSMVFVPPVVEQYRHRQPFDRHGWLNERGTAKWPMRLRMVDDLLAKHSFTGVTRDSVERLLGPADSARAFGGFDMVYALGPERSPIGIDYEWLAFKLGPDGRVTRYEIITD